MSRRRIAALLLVLALVAGACSNASDDSSGAGDDAASDTSASDGPLTYAEVLELPIDENVPVDAPGVDDSTIRVGGVASTTNPIGGTEGEAFEGVEAYFEYMNSQGGVYGRDLQLVAQEDDNTGFENTQDIQSLLTQDLFAVLPVATLDFSGAELLVDANMPTFGWNINEEYALGDNLFGMRGYLCFTCPGQGSCPGWPRRPAPRPSASSPTTCPSPRAAPKASRTASTPTPRPRSPSSTPASPTASPTSAPRSAT